MPRYPKVSRDNYVWKKVRDIQVGEYISTTLNDIRVLAVSKPAGGKLVITVNDGQSSWNNELRYEDWDEQVQVKR